MPHGVGQHLEFARHPSGRDGPQVAAPEPFGRGHESNQRTFHPAQRERADDGTDERRGDQHQPEHDFALASQCGQSLSDHMTMPTTGLIR